jgi:ketosteroid isomerase-like protein
VIGLTVETDVVRTVCEWVLVTVLAGAVIVLADSVTVLAGSVTVCSEVTVVVAVASLVGSLTAAAWPFAAPVSAATTVKPEMSARINMTTRAWECESTAARNLAGGYATCSESAASAVLYTLFGTSNLRTSMSHEFVDRLYRYAREHGRNQSGLLLSVAAREADGEESPRESRFTRSAVSGGYGSGMTAVRNKQVMQSIFAELSRGNSTPFGEAMADDFSWTVIGSTKWSGTYRGKQAVLDQLMAPLFAQFADRYTNVADRFIAEGDHVVVECRGRVTTKAGKAYNNTYCYVCRLSGGKLQELTEYCDTELVTAALAPPASVAREAD